MMVKRKTKTCSGCRKEKEIFHGLSTRFPKCQDCMPKKEKKPLKRTPLKKKAYKIPKQTKSQKEIQKEDMVTGRKIWAERDHECVECGAHLGDELHKGYLSHLMTKGSHPGDLRQNPKNIVLHCRICHNFWEYGGKRYTMDTYWNNIDWMQENGYVLQE